MSAPVVVGFDGSATARSAVQYGAREALRRGCGLRIVHAFGWPVILPPFHAPYDQHDRGPRAAMLDLLAQTAYKVQADHPHLSVTTRLIDGSPGAILVGASRDAQLLVVGHRGLGGFSGLLVGSVAAQAAEHARCPVVVVRGDCPPDAAPVVLGTDGSPGANRAAEVAFAQAQLRDVELILAHHQPARRRSGRCDRDRRPRVLGHGGRSCGGRARRRRAVPGRQVPHRGRAGRFSRVGVDHLRSPHLGRPVGRRLAGPRGIPWAGDGLDVAKLDRARPVPGDGGSRDPRRD